MLLEQKVVQVLLDCYFSLGLGFIVQVVKQVEVSDLIVFCFVVWIGFLNYLLFQQVLYDEIDIVMNLLFVWMDVFYLEMGMCDSYVVIFQWLFELFVMMIDGFDVVVFDVVVVVLVDLDVCVFCGGGCYMVLFVLLFLFMLVYVWLYVQYVELNVNFVFVVLVDMGCNDVFVIFDFCCYQKDSICFVQVVY